MNNIKKIYTFIWFAGSLLATSCSNFLDIQPTGKVIPNTLEEYRALMTQAYAQSLTDRGVCDMRTGDITINDDAQNQSDFGNIEQWSVNNTTGYEFGWGPYYENIYYANAIIDKMDEITEGSQDDINQLVGEAYFMRAYMHFLLVNFYGQPYTKSGAIETKAIPLKLTLNLEETLTRNTVNEIYASILSDIEKAHKLINQKEWETGYNYRFSTLAVDAFKSRTHLYMGEWEEAYDAAERVLTQKATLENYNSTEFMLPNRYNSIESIVAYENVYNLNTLSASEATAKFVQMFERGDLRPAQYFKDINEKGNYPIKKTDKTSEYKCSFRVSELYLNAAEAAAHLNKLTEARSRLLQLMEKRYAPSGYTLKEGVVNNMDQTELIIEILNERARELAFEGHRWFDLRRTTRPKIEKTLSSGQTVILQQDDPRYTLSIPQSATTANPDLMD